MSRSKRRGDPGGVSEEQLRRVAYYESLLNEIRDWLSGTDGSPEELLTLGDRVGELREYYGSEEWKRDFSDEEAGLFPTGLRRGVLSEDGIYHVLEEYRERLDELDAGISNTEDRRE